MSAAQICGIRTAEPGDADDITQILTAAFLHGDLGPWLVSSVEDRKRIYPPYFAMLTQHALAHAQVELTDDRAAVAVWYEHDGRELPPIADYDARLLRIAAPYAARFVALDDAMHHHHPTGRPHRYLAYLAVHPQRHRQGYGARLLRHHHAQLDSIGAPAYLEATGSGNRSLYLRHGYQPGEPYRIVRNGPVLFPMWRAPGRAEAAGQLSPG